MVPARLLLNCIAMSLAGALMWASPVLGMDESPYRVGPASAALGGSGRGAVIPTESGWLNPAALAHISSYHFALSHQQSNRESGEGYRDYAVLLADGGQDRMAAGHFSYIQRSVFRPNPSGGKSISAEQRDFQGSLAIRLPWKNISIGGTFRRLIHEQAGADLSQNTFALGVMLPITGEIGIGLTGHDLLASGEKIGTAPEEALDARLIPRIGVGFHAIPFSILHVRVDLVRPLEKNPGGRQNAHIGLESWFRDDFAFRVGGAWLETRDEMWLTTGLGFKGPRLSLGYSFEKEVRTANGVRHTFDLWLPL